MLITGQVVGFIRRVNLKNGRSKAVVLADLVTLDDSHIADYENRWEATLKEYGYERMVLDSMTPFHQSSCHIPSTFGKTINQ